MTHVKASDDPRAFLDLFCHRRGWLLLMDSVEGV